MGAGKEEEDDKHAMDADLDWCLTCERRLDGPEPYCSEHCKQRAGPAAYVYHNDAASTSSSSSSTHNVVVHPSTQHSWRWVNTDDAAIAAWAADVPYGAPPAEPEPAPTPASSSSSSSSSSPFRAAPPPNLIRPARRAVPPTLSMSTPPRDPPTPSTPVLTPRRHPSSTSMAPSGYASMGQTSLCTAATGSSLALSTPPPSHPVPIAGSAGRHHHPHPHTSTRGAAPRDAHVVRSWVSPSPAALAPSTARHYPHLQHLLDAAALQKSASRMHLVPEPLYANSWRPDEYDLYEEKAPPPLTRVHTFGRDEHPSFRTRGRKESRAAA